MAKELWNNPIDKNVDWGGDESTNGLPVSGEMVQRFIKESFDGKAGVFYYDTANNRYIVFADKATRDEYLDDPTKTDLILGAFDAPFNYMAEINLATPTYNAVYLGATGNYLDFTFDVKNKQGASTGENVVITYTFIRNATKQVFSQVARYGEAIRFNVDKYLAEGLNTVIVGVTGQTTLAATTASITYQVVNLQLTDELDISTVYDLSSGAKTMTVPFAVQGVGIKVVEWYLDGVLLDFVKNEDEIVEIEAQRVKNIELANLQQGRHSLQMRAYTTINGERFYTPTLYRDVMVYTGANSATIIGLAFEIPVQHGLAGSAPTIYGLTQYAPYTLRFATYSPTNKLNTPVTVAMSGEVLGAVSSNNGIVNEFSIVAKTSGNKTITLTAGDTSYEIPAQVTPTSMDIDEITSGLTLDFSAIGKSNNAEDKDSWAFGDYTGTFAGFSWNAGSGWVNNRLFINSGASFSVNYAPLAVNPVGLGRTLEFEFKTVNVNDDDAVICDLRNSQGVGLVITATKVYLKSENGVEIQNEFKADETVRLGIVINRSASSSRKGMTFIYANGTVSRCVNWESADNYESDALLSFVGSAGAEVELKAIRIYEAALTDDNMLTNFILYRDTVAEMQEVYDRNAVYSEGTKTFAPDKMVSRLPVMIVTGDIPTLENTSDKDTQVIVDIEYTNMQDPSRSFKMVGAAMRPQGTSSMGYPKKNFRIYTREVANTVVYDADGKVVPDKLYSFKDGAIPVDCWCLKADYAESSGTHNTGIARMWNEALYNMQIGGEYVCRTGAQKAALAAGYPYDVRTTIDGFPILMFYRRNATDEPIFIGKYNFNNDKSTEKVFGFTDIPGFDNSKMQCWEILNNGNPLALFQTVSGFDSGWKETYESRYPDTKTPNTADLKAFSTWMVGVNGNHTRFATEKWDHFNVYMMAAYYCYIMRHAAADQLVKNAMFTSEDGQKFYFILYDNDTINGLINTGVIDILPTDDRDSQDASGQYKFAGHGSVLWNMLEADEEFMQIVKDVDNALYSAGISYNECVRIFDEEQADKWVERVYNQDSEYKYVGPYVNNGINNLEMLQGKRDLHRRWWLSKRFSIYDAKFVSGEYKSQAIELKCMNDTPAGQSMIIKAGYPLDYGYGINDVPRETGITLAAGESHTFTTAETVNLGDPIRIYGAPNIAELDLSPMANRLATISIANAYTEALGTRLEKLIIGGEGVNNVEVSDISGLKMAKKLTHLNIMGMKGLKALDLTSQPYFEKLSAIGSEIASVSFAKGAPVTRLELPTTMKALNLEQLPYLTAINLVLPDITGIHTINVKGCPNLANDFSWVNNWYNRKSTVDSKCTLIMDNVNWTGAAAEDLVNLAKIGTLDLKGKVVLESITLEQINALIDAFGESAFNRNSDFYIDAPDAVFVSGRTELLEGESEDYNCIVFGGEVKRLTWSIYSGGNSYVTIDATTGVLSTTEGMGNRSLVIRVIAVTTSGTKTSDINVEVKARVYPQSYQTSISGSSRLEETRHTYRLTYSVEGITGDMVAVWSLSGMEGYAEIESYNDTSCVVKKIAETTTLVQGTLSCTLKKRYNNSSLFTVSKNIELINESIAESDAGIVTSLYNAGLCANSAYITKEEAALITPVDLQPGTSYSGGIFYSQRSNVKSFDGFKYFTGVTHLNPYTVYGWSNCTSMTLPTSLTEVADSNFNGMNISIRLDISHIKVIGQSCFTKVTLGDIVVNSCGHYSFQSCNIDSVTCAAAEAKNIFGECTIGTIKSLEGMEVMSGAFYGAQILDRKVPLPSTLTTWEASNSGYNPFSNHSNKRCIADFTLPESNPYFKTEEGILYSKDGKTLRCLNKDIDYLEISNVDTIARGSINGSINKLKISAKTIESNASPGSFLGTSLVFAEGVESIDYRAFGDCSNLQEITFPSTLKTIGSENFTRISVPIPEVVIPEGCTSVMNAFNYSYIDRIVFPSTLTGRFSLSAYCKEVVVHPECTITELSVTSQFLTSIPNIPPTCKTVDIRDILGIESIVIPEGVTSLTLMARYSGDVALRYLDLPSTLKSMYPSLYRAFNLSTIISRAVDGSFCTSTHQSWSYNSYYAGMNTAGAGQNILYVPNGATGYDNSSWMLLQDETTCNFTLSATL